MKKIVLTGGGTAGHVTPNIALLPALQAAGYEVAYVGSSRRHREEADRRLQYSLHGNLHRQISQILRSEKLLGSFPCHEGIRGGTQLSEKLSAGCSIFQGRLRKRPVVRAAASLHIPCIIHESDMTPGLANKLCIPVAEKVCCNFPETMKNIPADKAVLTGSPSAQNWPKAVSLRDLTCADLLRISL